jgi:hypothetical protein
VIYAKLKLTRPDEARLSHEFSLRISNLPDLENLLTLVSPVRGYFLKSTPVSPAMGHFLKSAS